MWSFPQGYRASREPAVILAHGAGADMHHPFLSFVHEALARSDILSVKFNFPYMELGHKAPDPPQRLARAWRAVIADVREQANPGALFIGGKSMGGRIASHVAAEGEPVSGLIFLGYPLHAAGRVDTLRAKHLAGIASPMLFVQGSRDKLCDLGKLEAALAGREAITLHVIEAGDHSFRVPKRAGRSEADIWQEIAASVVSWLGGQLAVRT